MTAIVADPRTEEVARRADEVDHIVCADCWMPGMPTLCGIVDEEDGPICPWDCTAHPTCPMCAELESSHLCLTCWR